MKIFTRLFFSVFILILAACSKAPIEQKTVAMADRTKPQKIVIASIGSDADIWKYIATLPETKAAGLVLEIKNFTDGIAMNTAVANREIDLNAFQSYNYMLAFNEQSKDKIAAVSTTYIEPMGIYSDKYKKLDELPNKATIAIPNDVANEARALSLLQTAGLIKLKVGFDPLKAIKNDIVENPKQLQIKSIPSATALRVKSEVDAIALGNTIALEGGLNVLKDAIFNEPTDQSTKLYVNLLVTAVGRENDPILVKVATLYHTKAVEKYIAERFGGTKTDVNRPLSYLTDTK